MLHFTIKKERNRIEKKGIRNMEVRVAHTRTSFVQWFMVFSLPKKIRQRDRNTEKPLEEIIHTCEQVEPKWNVIEIANERERERVREKEAVKGSHGACCKCAAQYKSI